jgi:hypothetical protein
MADSDGVAPTSNRFTYFHAKNFLHLLQRVRKNKYSSAIAMKTNENQNACMRPPKDLGDLYL